jgi:hypothetical protein
MPQLYCCCPKSENGFKSVSGKKYLDMTDYLDWRRPKLAKRVQRSLVGKKAILTKSEFTHKIGLDPV